MGSRLVGIGLRWDIAAGLMTAMLAVAGMWANGSTVAQQRDLGDASRYEALFDVGQLAAQVLRLEDDLAASLVPQSGVETDAVVVQADLVRRQVDLLRDRDLHADADADAEIAQVLTAVGNTVNRLAADLPNGGKPVAKDDLHRLRALDAPLSHLVALLHAATDKAISGYQARLSPSYKGMFVPLVGLVASGLALIAILIWRAMEAIRFARIDALTGFPNRRAFHEHLTRRGITRSRAGQMAVLLIDLDGFRSLNDTFGDTIGDALLCAVARQLSGVLPAGAQIARIGVDEFAIAVQNRDVDAQVAAVLAQIDAAATHPIVVGGISLRPTSSIGIAVDDLAHPLDLLRRAELALYDAKANGAGLRRFFTGDLDESRRRRQETEAELKAAIAAEQLEVWFQPIVDLRDRTVVSCEALVRWRHPIRGMVGPSEFIPLAEELGLIEQIGEWVLHHACRIAMTWPAEIAVSVNLSARQLRNDRAMDVIRAALASTGLPANRLELEVTESMLIQDASAAAALIDGLRALGARVALDDFGTGYASLSYLNQFSFDKIKIDQSFVRSLADRPQSSAILEAIVRMADGLGIVTTAEGIETDDHLAAVMGIGCHQGQGYLFGRPREPQAFRRFLDLARVSSIPKQDRPAIGRAA